MNALSKWDVAALCIAGAIAVAASGNDGWGWLLFVAVLFS